MRPLLLALVHLHHTLVYDKSGGHDVAHGMYATYVVKSTLLSGMNCQCTYLYIHCQILVLCTYIKSSSAPLSPTPLTPIHPPPPPPPRHCHQRPPAGLASLAQLGSSVFCCCSVQQRELVASGCGQKAPALCSFEAYYMQLMNGEGEGAQGEGPYTWKGSLVL